MPPLGTNSQQRALRHARTMQFILEIYDMTEEIFQRAIELNKRSKRFQQSLINLHDIAEGRPNRMDPLQQEDASKQTAVRFSIANERVVLSLTAWEEIYTVIERDLRSQIKASDEEFGAL